MKNPLRYQISEYDCGITTMENAISYMLPRENIPPEILHYINLYLLDSYTKKGWGYAGTTHEGMNYFSIWLSKFFKEKSIKINVDYKTKKDVTYESIKSTFDNNKNSRVSAVIYCYDTCGHYVLVTGFTPEGDVKIFDSYYRDKVLKSETKYKIVDNAECEYNRIIKKDNFASFNPKVNFSLGPEEEREVLYLIKKKKKRHKKTSN